MKNSDKIDVIIPVYNEEEILETFYHRIKSLTLDLNLIFVDNASNDNTPKLLEGFADITVIKHEKNEGYGGSIIDGIEQSDGDIIVIIDADCEFPPESIPDMIEALKEQEVVYGSRFLDQKSVDMPWSRIIGNKFISHLFNFLYRQKTTDLYTGFKAFRRSALDDISLTRKGFEHVLEMGAKLAKKGVTINEIPIKYAPRSTGTAKMKHFTETLKFMYYLIYYRICN